MAEYTDKVYDGLKKKYYWENEFLQAAREVLDSRGNPTIEAEVITETGAVGSAADVKVIGEFKHTPLISKEDN